MKHTLSRTGHFSPCCTSCPPILFYDSLQSYRKRRDGRVPSEGIAFLSEALKKETKRAKILMVMDFSLPQGHFDMLKQAHYDVTLQSNLKTALPLMMSADFELIILEIEHMATREYKLFKMLTQNLQKRVAVLSTNQNFQFMSAVVNNNCAFFYNLPISAHMLTVLVKKVLPLDGHKDDVVVDKNSAQSNINYALFGRSSSKGSQPVSVQVRPNAPGVVFEKNQDGFGNGDSSQPKPAVGLDERGVTQKEAEQLYRNYNFEADSKQLTAEEIVNSGGSLQGKIWDEDGLQAFFQLISNFYDKAELCLVLYSFATGESRVVLHSHREMHDELGDYTHAILGHESEKAIERYLTELYQTLGQTDPWVVINEKAHAVGTPLYFNTKFSAFLHVSMSKVRSMDILSHEINGIFEIGETMRTSIKGKQLLIETYQNFYKKGF